MIAKHGVPLEQHSGFRTQNSEAFARHQAFEAARTNATVRNRRARRYKADDRGSLTSCQQNYRIEERNGTDSTAVPLRVVAGPRFSTYYTPASARDVLACSSVVFVTLGLRAVRPS
jgi:hypothetical protein